MLIPVALYSVVVVPQPIGLGDPPIALDLQGLHATYEKAWLHPFSFTYHVRQ